MFNGRQSPFSQEGLNSDESPYPSLGSEDQYLNKSDRGEGPHKESDYFNDQDSSDYSGRDKHILRRRTLAVAPLRTPARVSNQSMLSEGKRDNFEKRRMTVPMRMLSSETTLEQCEEGSRNIVLLLVQENKDLKTKLENVSLRQQTVVANTIKKMEEKQAEMTRQMANDIEQMMQRHQDEIESLNRRLQQREDELAEVQSRLEELQILCHQQESEIAELQKDKLLLEEAKQTISNSISPADTPLQDQNSVDSGLCSDQHAEYQEEGDEEAEAEIEEEPNKEESILELNSSSLSSQLQQLQYQLESEQSRHIEEVELLQLSFNQQQQRVIEQYEMEIDSLKHRLSDEVAEQIKVEHDKQNKVIQVLNDRILTLSETATRSMEAHHEIKEKYEGMKVEYQNLYDLYQELKGVTKDVIAAVKTKERRITTLERVLAERESLFAESSGALDGKTSMINDFSSVTEF